jgi:hypothetical protein
MNAKSSANTMPLVREHKRERAGENILFNARTRSKIAKQGGDALSDLAQRDVDRTGRYPVRAEIGTGGELVPAEPDLRDTVKNPDYVTSLSPRRHGGPPSGGLSGWLPCLATCSFRRPSGCYGPACACR